MAELRKTVANLKARMNSVPQPDIATLASTSMQALRNVSRSPPADLPNSRSQKVASQDAQHFRARHGASSYSSVEDILTLSARKTSTSNSGALTLLNVYSHEGKQFANTVELI